MLFDHLVCPREQYWRDGKSQRLCRFEVDDQLKFRRLFNRKLFRPGTLEDTIYVVCKAPVRPDEARPIGTNRAALRKHRPAGNYRRTVAHAKLDDSLAILDCEPVSKERYRLWRLRDHGSKRGCQIFLCSCGEVVDSDTQALRGLYGVGSLQMLARMLGIGD